MEEFGLDAATSEVGKAALTEQTTRLENNRAVDKVLYIII
jgi:hypothetical protein